MFYMPPWALLLIGISHCSLNSSLCTEPAPSPRTPQVLHYGCPNRLDVKSPLHLPRWIVLLFSSMRLFQPFYICFNLLHPFMEALAHFLWKHTGLGLTRNALLKCLTPEPVSHNRSWCIKYCFCSSTLCRFSWWLFYCNVTKSVTRLKNLHKPVSSVGILTWGGKKHIKRPEREGVGFCFVMIAFLPSFAHQKHHKPTSPTINQDKYVGTSIPSLGITARPKPTKFQLV